MIIRIEEPKDYPAVRTVNTSAFATPAEAALVDVLRKEASPYISIVAEDSGDVVGHILFTPVILTGGADLNITGLGPMAVLPAYQGKGIGSALVRAGLEKCRENSFGACVVLGHSWFYPRFGFVPSVNFGVSSEFDVRPEVFMVMELIPGYLRGASGTIKYHPAFRDV